MRGGARQQEEVVDRVDPPAVRSLGVDPGVEGHQRDRDVRGVGGDAVLADAENGMAAVEAVQGRTAAARVPFVARRRRIAEVAAAHPLHHVAAHARHVAQLCGGPELQRLGDHREPLAYGGRLGHLAHPGQGADVQAAVRTVLDLGEGQIVDVHQAARQQYVLAQQIHLGGAPGQEVAGGVRGYGGDRIGDGVRTGVTDGPHNRAP